ncbi:MAG TPA: DNA internalization-related competence protein ComEC/Rec2 [Methylophilaceae bacterium]|jgi:competence protein ComEC
MTSALLAFVFGAWVLQQQAVLPHLSWALALVPLVFLCYRRPTLWLLVPLAAFAGFFWAAASAQHRLADALPTAWEGQNIQVVGVVASLPQQQEHGQRFVFDVEQTLTPQAHVPAKISLNSYADEFHAHQTSAAPIFKAGERWQLTVKLKHPHGAANPHGFDLEAWALELNIRATGYIRNDNENRRLNPLVNRPAYWVEHVREKLRDHMQQVLQGKPYASTLLALAIGDDSGISRHDWQVYRRTGVTHLMSISGLHITMISGLIFALTQALWRRSKYLPLRLPARKAAVVAGMLTALAYTLIAGFGVPAQRTVYMLAVVAAALWSGRNVSFSLVLAWALVVTVLLDPWAVNEAGFWLSFGAVAVIVYASGSRLERPHWLREALNTQWAVTLGLMPLLLVLFQQSSLVAPLANAFAIPMISLLITPLTLLGAVLPFDFILLAAHQLMQWCMYLLQPLSDLPDAVWQQAIPPWWALIFAMLGTLWILLPRGFSARWLGLIYCAPLFLVVPETPAIGSMKIAVLDVGQGLSVVVQTAHHALLYDTGPSYSADADSGNRIIVPYLRAAGISHLDGMMVTHNDNDHSGGAISVLQEVPVGWFASSLPADHAIVAVAPQPRRCYAGQQWQWDGVSFEMLHPTWQSYDIEKLKDNDRGCVLKVTSRFGTLLLPADIESPSEQMLVETQPDALIADVLVVPHHGSKTSSTPDFIAHVHPLIAIFTTGYRNRFGHPKPEIVERYKDSGSRMYRSDQDGAILLDFGVKGISANAWRKTAHRYWDEAE